jgi:phage terminase large subunit-like protein
LGANTDSLDGLNPSGALIDELHAHRDNSMLTVLQTAMGARRQPLLGVISTAGTNPVENPCRIEQSYCERILDPANAEGADDYWPFVFQLDDGDDCYDERVWPKANPNLDVSISREYLRKQAAKARAVPEELAGFKTRHCNMWVDHAGPSIWIPHDQWSACAAPMPDEALVGLPCVAGLDGADVGDLFAYALAWLLADGRVYVRCHYWTTLGTLAARVQKERLAYDAWLQAGWLNATDTQANDLFAIAERIRADHDRFRFVEVRYDPHFLKLFAEQLTNAGIMCVEFRQTGSQFTEPGRAFSAAVRERRILHDGNPVTAWCVSNTRWKEFEDEKGMPMKIGKAHQRIDGLVASLMAHSGAVRVGNKPPVPELWMPAVRKW